jgi:hypothetical protein
MHKFTSCAGIFAASLGGFLAIAALAAEQSAAPVATDSRVDANVPFVCEDRRPPAVDPGSYGMQLDGGFRHPHATPVDEENPHAFAGRRDDYDHKSYISGLKIEAAYEGADFVPDPFHTWQNIVDFKGHRYLFQYDRSDGRVYDITDIRRVTVIERLSRDDVKADYGVNKETMASHDWPAYDFWGASSIQWNAKLKAYVMVQSFEQKRQVHEVEAEPPHDKFNNMAGVAALRASPQLKGFKVFELRGPRKQDWRLLANVSTDDTQSDSLHTDFGRAPQQGSGSLDVPYYTGEKYLFIAVAPNDRYSNTEYPNYLYSPGYQAWDMSDPKNPRLLGNWHRDGQVNGETAVYRANPRCGNRTSWMGARMPLFIPRPVEAGGKYGFAALAGFGVSVIDIADPAHMREVGHVDLPPSVAGTEADSIDVSQYEQTGLIYVSGYPLTEDCYEPYKDIFQIDVRDPAKPHIVGALPRPRPPADSGLSDYCQRRGSFGPKRSGYYTSPGEPPQGLLVYAFYNAGVQLFDVKDPAHPRIAAYFVPKAFGKDTPDYAYGNQTHGVYIEWDRKIIWAFTNHGIYALSAAELIGAPTLGAPARPFRTSVR